MCFNFFRIVIWVLLLVGVVVAPSTWFATQNENDTSYNETVLTPPSHSHSPHYHLDLKHHEVLKKKKKPTPPPPPPPPTVTQFDYFKMAETWPKSFCKVENCPNPPPLQFTIHGLWPSNSNDPQPRRCFTNQKLNWADLKGPIMNEFYKYWPRLNMATKLQEYEFWTDQWVKHGACSSMSTKDYFELAFKIHKSKKDLLNSLRLKGITPDGTKKVMSQDIFKAIESDIGFKPQIMCREAQNQDYYLVDIRVCFHKINLEYTHCPSTPTEPLILCPTYVYFP